MVIQTPKPLAQFSDLLRVTTDTIIMNTDFFLQKTIVKCCMQISTARYNESRARRDTH